MVEFQRCVHSVAPGLTLERLDELLKNERVQRCFAVSIRFLLGIFEENCDNFHCPSSFASCIAVSSRDPGRSIEHFAHLIYAVFYHRDRIFGCMDAEEQAVVASAARVMSVFQTVFFLEAGSMGGRLIFWSRPTFRDLISLEDSLNAFEADVAVFQAKLIVPVNPEPIGTLQRALHAVASSVSYEALMDAIKDEKIVRCTKDFLDHVFHLCSVASGTPGSPLFRRRSVQCTMRQACTFLIGFMGVRFPERCFTKDNEMRRNYVRSARTLIAAVDAIASVKAVTFRMPSETLPIPHAYLSSFLDAWSACQSDFSLLRQYDTQQTLCDINRCMVSAQESLVMAIRYPDVVSVILETARALREKVRQVAGEAVADAFDRRFPVLTSQDGMAGRVEAVRAIRDRLERQGLAEAGRLSKLGVARRNSRLE